MGLLPVGAFMPLPLAMMIPFMGMQSAVMAKQFGENFQFGKRKISAMTNEEFNKLDPRTMMENTQQEIKAMLPTMEKSLQDMRAFQTFIVKELVATIKQLPSDIAGGLTSTPPGSFTGSGLPVNPLPSFNPQPLVDGIANFFNQLGNMFSNPLPQAFGFTGGTTTLPPDVSTLPGQDTSTIVPSGPNSGPQQPPPSTVNPPGFVDDRKRLQSEHEAKWDAYHKAKLNEIAIVVNNITATFNPPKRRRTQSTDIQLKGLIQGANQLLQLAIVILGRIKDDYANLNKIAQNKPFYDKKMVEYRNRQMGIAQHIKIYSA